jgi:hypothetical protein
MQPRGMLYIEVDSDQEETKKEEVWGTASIDSDANRESVMSEFKNTFTTEPGSHRAVQQVVETDMVDSSFDNSSRSSDRHTIKITTNLPGLKLLVPLHISTADIFI